jgi:hypothetical protein
MGITRQKDGSSSVVIGGLCTVSDGVSAFVMGTTNTRTSAWDDELADNACTKHKERTDFLGRYFAAEDGRGGQEASVGSKVSPKPSEIQLCHRPKARVTRNQEIFTIKETSDKISKGLLCPRGGAHTR